MQEVLYRYFHMVLCRFYDLPVLVLEHSVMEFGFNVSHVYDLALIDILRLRNTLVACEPDFEVSEGFVFELNIFLLCVCEGVANSHG